MLPTHSAAPKGTQFSRALIVEDDTYLRTLLTSILLQLGFNQVVGYGQIEPAMERLEYDAFDLGIIDLNLGGRDGVSLIAKVRSSTRVCVNAMPILVASTAATGDRINSAISAGADGFLCKPFSITNLRRQIQFVHMKADARRAAFAQESHRLPGSTCNILELD